MRKEHYMLSHIQGARPLHGNPREFKKMSRNGDEIAYEVTKRVRGGIKLWTRTVKQNMITTETSDDPKDMIHS